MRATIENICGVQTRYLEHGTGESGALLLHGVGVGADSWLWNLQSLGGDNLHCVAPDMLGFALTEEGSYREGSPQSHILAHLVSLIERLGWKRIILVGSSFGSSIACHLLFRVPSLVRGLVLVGCGPALNSVATLSKVYEASFANGLAAMCNPTLDVCTRRIKNLVYDLKTVPEALLMSQLTLYSLPEAAERYERRMRGIMQPETLERFDLTGRMHEINVPTLIIWGRHDIRGNLAEAEACAANILNSQMEIYEDCGHLPYLESPAQFNARLLNFITEID